MKNITNKTHKPLKISLEGGKALHLGPLKTGQISDKAAELPAVRKLVKAGDVELLDEGAAHAVGGQGTPAGHASTHGHHPTSVVRPKGDR